MSIADVMTVKVVSVEPGSTVAHAIQRMVDENIGAVAVCELGRIVGMFTERDVLRLAGGAEAFAGKRVDEVMTRQLVTVAPDDDIVAVARLMGERRLRHLPVVEGSHLLGIVGARDVMGALVERLWQTHDEQAHETARALLLRSH
jgi:CBS domain-containing protein